ncbi:MAG: ABC-F family ATP-binding cassette domain-containing protein [Gemmatimonadales bacterium]|nr:ABC-F family ATP-binding cassette domain-containing protein [Gemmatimonadales bacterium]
MTLLSASSLAVVFGAETLFQDITFTVMAGDRWGILGRNGSGKTTLMQIVTGARAPDRGSMARMSGLRIAVMDQYRDLGGEKTVWDAAALGFKSLFELEKDLARQGEALGTAGDALTQAQLDKYSHDLERFEREGGYAAAARVDAVLAGLGFDPETARTRDVASLSGGERGRLALAGQLAAPADLLILDEPTNHLDIATARWLEEYLKGLDEAVLLISHDRAFLNAVADHVLHLEAKSASVYECGYAEFIEQRAERRMSAMRAFRKQDSKIAAEEDFIRRNIAGGNSAQAKGRRKRLERVPRLTPPPGEEGAMAVSFTAGDRGGDQVLAAEKLHVRMEGRTLLEPWSGILRRGDRVGLVGPNGAGKSTLLKVLLGERTPDGGSVRIMPATRVAYYRQDLGDVDPAKSLYDLIADRRPMWTRGQIQGHLGRFDFSGDSVLRRAGSLSGGERARVALALMMLADANLLVFDEPTNHLDVESIEALEDAIAGYDGSVLLVSHDRALLQQLATRIWAFEDGVLHDYPGRFEEWEADAGTRRTARLAAEAETKRRAAARAAAPPPKDASADDAKRRRARERALEEAEALVARHEAELTALEAALADPALYAGSDRGGVSTLTAARDAERRKLEEAMAAWEAAIAAVDGGRE